jgi:amino acid permease
MIYKELAKKNLKNMEKVLIIGTIGATLCYMIAGIFGYVTFIFNSKLNDIMELQNILMVEQY